MDDKPIERCQHCGLHHPNQNLEDIARFCMAVKRVETAGYVYDHGNVVSHPRVESIEYFAPDEQRKLFEEAVRVNGTPDRAREALQALRDDRALNKLVVEKRLGAFLIQEDARQAVIEYGLGLRDADESVQEKPQNEH